MNLLQSVMDTSSHAMFILDHEGGIEYINKLAKTRFGLIHQGDYFHEGGKLEPGDIVILADTALGADDGNLTPEDLEVLGIQGTRLRRGDAFLCIARYQDPSHTPKFKFYPGKNLEYMRLEDTVAGIPIQVQIKDRTITIRTGGTQYILNYFLYVAQLVILDGKTGAVKFWEENGYSARKEGAGDVLRGSAFHAKSPQFELAVVGHNFREFFEGAKFDAHLGQLLQGQSGAILNEEYHINGFDLVASLFPIYEEDVLRHVVVRFRNIEDIQMIIQERNDAIRVVEHSYREIAENRNLFQVDPESLSLFGIGPSSDSARYQAYKLSQLDCDILITGESGTGKSYLAKAIHQAQPRKGPFLKVDCSTIVPTLLESELFGYVGGAFTGADPKGKAGFFEEAHGGTVFLDEIGEIPLELQAKFLNVIQNKTVTRVGSTKAVPVDVRILAATNRDLKAEVEAGNFRLDLYYRLSTFTVNLPPLRECPVEIYSIINNLMDTLPQKYGMGKKSLSGEAFARLTSYDWPGNIRELENVLERAVALSDSDIIYAEDIHLEETSPHLDMKSRLAAEERKIMQQVLMQYQGDKVKAMEALGMSKTAFYRKLKEYEL